MMNGELEGARPRIRCVVLILAGLAVAPVGFMLSVRNLLSRRLQWAAIMVPIVIAGVYWLAWETRDRCA